MKTKKYWILAVMLGIYGGVLWGRQAFIDYNVADTPEQLIRIIEEQQGTEVWGQNFQQSVLEGLSKFAIFYRFQEKDGILDEYQTLNSPDLEKKVRSAVELKLRVTGIPIVSLEEWRKTLTRPVLMVIVRIVNPDKKALEKWYKDNKELKKKHPSYYNAPLEPPEYMSKHYISVTITMLDQLSLVRKPDMPFYSGIWGDSENKHTGSADCNYVAEQFTKDIMDRFVGDYLAANPKSVNTGEK